MTAPAEAAPMRECTCNGKCPMTDDQHWVDCPAHAYHDAWIKMQSKAAPMREDVTVTHHTIALTAADCSSLICEHGTRLGLDPFAAATIARAVHNRILEMENVH